MPMAIPSIPSLQTAALKVFLETNLSDVVVEELPLNLEFYLAGKMWRFKDIYNYKEWIFFSIFYESVYNRKIKQDNELTRLISLAKNTIEKILRTRVYDKVKDLKEVSFCFTTNYDQVYSSLYFMKSISDEFPDKKFNFIWGGASSTSERVKSLVDSYFPETLFIAGEGESKLLRALTSLWNNDDLTPLVQDGVFRVSSVVDLRERNNQWYSNQLKSESLISPDFSPFFNAVEFYLTDELDRTKFLATVEIPFEVSRGCLLKCSFCSLNYIWDGYRKLNLVEKVESMVLLSEKYGVRRVRFVDNLCNPWAKEFLKIIENQNVTNLTFHLELRAKEKIDFWESVVSRNVRSIELGIEAMSPNILKNVNKGTNILDNIKAIKTIDNTKMSQFKHLLLNIITHYPDSTVEDVKETKEILHSLSHFTHFKLFEFSLMQGSPIYNKINGSYSGNYEIENRVFSAEFYDWEVGPTLKIPHEFQLKNEVSEEWKQLKIWYDSNILGHLVECRLTNSTIVDSRWGNVLEYAVTDCEKEFINLTIDVISLDDLYQINNNFKQILENFIKLKFVFVWKNRVINILSI
jgi:radical SAM superfamily enzyme YgiQ (UPF0313 family)